MNERFLAVARDIHDAGGRALLVGGCVRDGLLSLPCSDIDCEVHGLARETLFALLERHGHVDRSGEAFGVFTLPEIGVDFALPRMEKRTGSAHTDFEIEAIPDLSPMQAAARRDFTVNAIMQDALTGEIIDPYGGEEDLKNGVLRAVPGGQFEEDPLRVLRGAQFAARFHLTPEEDTLKAMRRMPLCHLSGPRVMAEMKKALLHSDAPDVFFRVLCQANALSPWFKELDSLRGVPQNPVYHPEGDAFEHTMLVLREAAALRARAKDPLLLMLAALTHDLGKAVTTKKNDKGNWQSIGHETAGMPLAESLLSRLGAGKQHIALCKNLCKLHMRVHNCFSGGARETRTHLLFDECMDPDMLALLCIADARGKGGTRENAEREEAFILGRLRAYREAAAREMPTGQMFLTAGAKPGPQMKTMIREARRRTLLGMDAREAVRAEIRENERKKSV